MKQTSLRAIANKAASDKAHRFRNLFGLLTVEFLLWCWQCVNLRAASGVDRTDARSYRANLRENIEGLVAAAHGGWYRARVFNLALFTHFSIPQYRDERMPHGVRQDVDLKVEYDVAEPDKNCVSETSEKPGRLNILGSASAPRRGHWFGQKTSLRASIAPAEPGFGF